MEEGNLAATWVAGASSFPAAAFKEQRQEDVRINLEKALQYYADSTSSEEEGEAAGQHAAGGVGQAHGSSRRPEPRASGGSSSGGEGSGRDRPGRKRRDRREGKKTKHSKHKRPKRQESERDKVLRAERRALASGVALPERRGNSVWASEQNRLGQAGPLALDRDLMFTDKAGDLLNLTYHSLHLTDTPLFRRLDPLRLARGLPGGRPAQWDAFTSGPGNRPMARYYQASYVLMERSKHLRRIRLRDSAHRPLLDRIPAAAAGAEVGGGEDEGYPGAACWGAAPARQQLQGQQGAGRGRLALPLPAVLPLEPGAGAHAAATAGSAAEYLRQQQRGAGAGEGAAVGETVEEYVLRRTREHNVATRERPEDLGRWLRYAEFQAQAAQLLAGGGGGGGSRRGGAADGAAAEKRVSILERAAAHHPWSEVLLRQLLEASEALLEPEELCSRWQAALRRGGGREASPGLWCAYLRRRRRMFSLFKVPRLQVVYSDALHALALAHADLRDHHLSSRSAAAPAGPSVPQLEDTLIRITLDLIRMELEAGFTELAVARVQAVFEFHAFNPNAGGGQEGAVRRRGHYGAQLNQFEAFWESGAARVGEEGAAGWAAWYRKENRGLVVVPGGGVEEGAEEEKEKEEEGGGWQGWQEVPKSAAADEMEELQGDQRGKEGKEGKDEEEGDGDGDGGGSDEEEGEDGELSDEEGKDEEEEAEEEELNEEELLERLGVKLERDLEEMQRRGVEPEVLDRWLQEEQARGVKQWQPLRPEASSRQGQGQEPAEEAGRDRSSRVEYEDIAESVFPLEGSQGRERLLLGCLALLGVPLLGPEADGRGGAAPSGAWACSNQPSLLDEHVQLFHGSGGGVAAAGVAGAEGLWARLGLLGLSWAAPWFCGSEERRAMVARLLLLLLEGKGVFVGHPQVTMGFLLVEAAGVEELHQRLGGGGRQGWREQQQLWGQLRLAQAARAREAAGALLARQRENAVLVTALGALQALLGRTTLARRVLDSTLAGASAAAAAAPGSSDLPLLALQYADAELAMAAAGATAPPVAEARALHILQWLLEAAARGPAATFQPYSPAAAAAPDAKSITAARNGFAAAVTGWVAEALQDGAGPAAAAAAAVVAANMLYEVLASRAAVDGGAALGAGVEAAVAAFKNTAGAVSAEVRAASAAHEWLYVWACQLLVSEQSAGSKAGLGFLSPAVTRGYLLQGLRLYPGSPKLLELLERAEHAAHANVRLRRALMQALEVGPSTQLLEAALRAEAARLAEGGGAGGGGAAASSAAALAVSGLERVFEKALAAAEGRLAATPLAWQMYFRLEVAAGRMDAARKVLLRAVRECPGCKALWLEGLRELNGVIPPREVSDLMEVAADKGLRLRADIMEAMLQHLAEAKA